mmetsp:Transcript_13116/g.39080  ORF Transcript_13116/g.39080 Transcript_13116/m.39080 type:complete len:266 (-) Transcript_13116:678-1475(-)
MLLSSMTSIAGGSAPSTAGSSPEQSEATSAPESSSSSESPEQPDSSDSSSSSPASRSRFFRGLGSSSGSPSSDLKSSSSSSDSEPSSTSRKPLGALAFFSAAMRSSSSSEAKMSAQPAAVYSRSKYSFTLSTQLSMTTHWGQNQSSSGPPRASGVSWGSQHLTWKARKQFVRSHMTMSFSASASYEPHTAQATSSTSIEPSSPSSSGSSTVPLTSAFSVPQRWSGYSSATSLRILRISALAVATVSSAFWISCVGLTFLPPVSIA